MRITFATLTTGLIYTLVIALISKKHLVFEESILTFGFIIIPILLSVCFFHLLINFFHWTKINPSLILQILIFGLLLNLILVLLHLPDFIRHQTAPHYERYNSIMDYFVKEMSEAVITATCFSIVIPVLDNYINYKINKRNTAQSN